MGCAGTPPSTLLNANQAGKLSSQLANNKAFTLYHCVPFLAGRPARFEGGHWLWSDQEGFGHGDLQATVELAADGSTNRADLHLSANLNY